MFVPVQHVERDFSIHVRIHDARAIFDHRTPRVIVELSAAKVALHSQGTRQICGREEERRVIEEFCLQKSKSSNEENEERINNPCLYIYGAPGTGKR